MCDKNYTLITGASSGIGYEMAKIYAAKGEPLILVARRTENLIALQSEYPQLDIHVISLDLSHIDNAYKLYEITQQANLCVYRLINNAGVGVFGDFQQTDLAQEVAMVNLNIQCLMILTKLYLTPMQQRNQGEILNVSSIASFMPGPQMSVYYATKAFVTSFSKALKYELRHTNIKVSILAPSTTDTDFVKSANLENSTLFDRLKAQSATTVAQYAVQHLGKKSVLFPHRLSQLLIFLSRFIPDPLLLKIVAYIQQHKS